MTYLRRDNRTARKGRNARAYEAIRKAGYSKEIAKAEAATVRPVVKRRRDATR